MAWVFWAAVSHLWSGVPAPEHLAHSERSQNLEPPWRRSGVLLQPPARVHWEGWSAAVWHTAASTVWHLCLMWSQEPCLHQDGWAESVTEGQLLGRVERFPVWGLHLTASVWVLAPPLGMYLRHLTSLCLFPHLQKRDSTRELQSLGVSLRVKWVHLHEVLTIFCW